MNTHFTTLNPTPTTLLFTVSHGGLTNSTTRPLPTFVLFYLTLLLRLLLALLIVLVQVSHFKGLLGTNVAEATFWEKFPGSLAVGIAGSVDWRIGVLGGLAGFWLVGRRGYVEESLLVIRGLGVQTSSSSKSYFSTSTTRFIPATQIQDIVIHEAFKGLEVRFYLAIIVQGESEVVVVFPNLLPKRAVLEEVWRGARKCLYEGRG